MSRAATPATPPPNTHPRDLMCAYEVVRGTSGTKIAPTASLAEALAEVRYRAHVEVPHVQTWDEGLEFARILATEHAARAGVPVTPCGGTWQTGWTLTTTGGTQVWYTVRVEIVDLDVKAA